MLFCFCRVAALGLVATFAQQTFASETLRIGAWNIENLHHKEYVKLRSFSVYRETRHYDLLAKYTERFGADGAPADIIALQEIGTKQAAERLYPPSEYTLLMSSRWKNDDALPGAGDIYTAIAIRKDSGIEVLDRDDISELSIYDPKDKDYTRSGTAALVQSGDLKFWFVSLHLKSGCSDTKGVASSTTEACRTLWQQAPLLEAWVAEKRPSGVPVILAGDFNRRFRQFQMAGQFWTAINGDDASKPWFEAHPITDTRKCPTRKGNHDSTNSTQPIDWILLDVKLADRFVADSFFETRFAKPDVDAAKIGSKSTGLSDHCPISVQLMTEPS